MSTEEEIAILIHRADQMGFNIVDLYHEGEELIAFTCSRSMDYIKGIQKVRASNNPGKNST